MPWHVRAVHVGVQHGFFLIQYPKLFRPHLARLLELWSTGQLNVVLDAQRFVGLEDVPAAVDRLQDGKSMGKVSAAAQSSRARERALGTCARVVANLGLASLTPWPRRWSSKCQARSPPAPSPWAPPRASCDHRTLATPSILHFDHED